MDKEIFSRPLGLKNVEINDEFWGREQALVRKEVIPYQWDALNDRIPEAEPSFCMRNFKVAGRLMREKRENKKFIEPKYTFRGLMLFQRRDRSLRTISSMALFFRIAILPSGLRLLDIAFPITLMQNLKKLRMRP